MESFVPSNSPTQLPKPVPTFGLHHANNPCDLGGGVHKARH
jgi:hypothetical protein